MGCYYMLISTKIIARLLGAACMTVSIGAWAQADSPVGLWKTIDDETKQAKSLVRITESGGQLSGKIEKILTDKPDAVCEVCSGDLKDKPVQGMVILRGLKKGGDWWEGGTILDPNNGKTYRSQARTIDGGTKLEVRGYIGTPLLGRSQTWIREQ
jgi:uncharacterized protein (DUF2147 family)